MPVSEQATEPRKLSFLIGCRWSAEDGGASSITDQETYCRRFVAKREGTVVDVVQADGEKGRTMDRSDIRAINAHLAADTIDAVVYKDDSRFCRTVRGFTKWLEQILEPANKQRVAEGKAPVLVYFAKDGFCFNSITEESYCELIQRILKNEEYSRKTTADIHIMQETKTAEGYWVYQFPFGTKKDFEHPGIPIKDDYWYLVPLMFEWYANGKSLDFIVAQFKQRGVPTRRGGYCWSPSKARNLLSSNFYNPEAGWLHDCTVNVEHYQATQQRLTKGSEAGRPTQKRVYVLDGLLHTSHFVVDSPKSYEGGALAYKGIVRSGRGDKPNYHVYLLKNHTPRYKDYYKVRATDPFADRLKVSVPADEAETAVLDVLINNPIDGLVVECARGRDDARKRLDKQLALTRRDLKAVKQERRTNYQRRIKALDADMMSTAKELDALIATLEQREGAAITKMDELEKELNALPDDATLRQGIERINALDYLWNLNTLESRKAVKEILTLLVSRVDLRCDSSTLHLRLPASDDALICTSVAGSAPCAARYPAGTR